MTRTLVALNALTLVGLWATTAHSLDQDSDRPATMKVRELLLVDERGRTRARLGFDAEDRPELAFFADSAEKRFRAGFVRSEDTGFEAFAGDGKKSVELRCRPDGTNSLMFKNRRGHNAFRLLAVAGGATLLDLSNERGGSAELRVAAEGQPDLVLNDETGRLRASLGVIGNGTSALTLFDSKNRGEVSAYAAKDGQTGISLFDTSRRPRAVLGSSLEPRSRSVTELPPGIRILDGRGATVWAAPRPR